jgi:hypothetical protein
MSDQLCRCCQAEVIEQGDAEDTRSDGSGLSYVDALMAPVEERLQEIRAITEALVEINPGGYKLVCDLATN